MEEQGIDFVIIWVDGNDRQWQHDKLKYQGQNDENIDVSNNRYRDWDNLQYLFRSIDKFAPWVRKVHFVTYGHVPDWLDLNAPKLSFVRHADYIPPKYLPTFSSHPIELNLHRISDLSENFVYFNDDMFITQPISKYTFFQNGIPRDIALNNRITSLDYSDPMPHIALNNTSIINKHFNYHYTIKKHFAKWFHPSYGIMNLMRSASLLPYPNFTGFLNPHIPAAFNKSTFTEIWDTEPQLLDEISTHKFRHIGDVNQYLMRNWQLATGKFHPGNTIRHSGYFAVNKSNIHDVSMAIENQKYSLLCLNDTTEDDIEPLKKAINKSFEKILPEKSSFEL